MRQLQTAQIHDSLTFHDIMHRALIAFRGGLSLNGASGAAARALITRGKATRSGASAAVARPRGGQLASSRRGEPPSPFDELLAPFEGIRPLAPFRPDRVMDIAEQLMGSMLPRGLAPRLPRVQDIERDIGRGLEQTIGFRSITLDIAERPDAYVITAEVPGVAKENLQVEVDEDSGLLTIAAEKTVEPSAQQQQAASSESAPASPASASPSDSSAAPAKANESQAQGKAGERDTTWLRAERSFGRIERSLSLPDDADYEQITAKLEHGVLTLTIPRRSGAPEEHGRRKVDIA